MTLKLAEEKSVNEKKVMNLKYDKKGEKNEHRIDKTK